MSDRWRPAGKLLAIDLGLARIGIATCDPLGLAARPVEVIRRRSRLEDFARIARLIKREEIVEVVCGLPISMDGSEGDQARMARKWAKRLARALHAELGREIEIIFWDERLSTFAAQQILDESGADIPEDAAAAAVILQSYLDAQKRGDAADYGRVVLPPPDLPQTGEEPIQFSPLISEKG